MAVLKSTNVQGALCVNGVAVGGGKDFKYCCFSSSTTFTPSQDLVDGDGALEATVVGGGGGGGYADIFLGTMTKPSGGTNVAVTSGPSGQGGGGGLTSDLIGITATTGCAVTVGAGSTTTDAVPYCCACFPCIEALNVACFTSSLTNGGNSSFAGLLAYGGGGGGMARGGQWYQCYSVATRTKNWSESGSTGLNGGDGNATTIGYGGGASSTPFDDLHFYASNQWCNQQACTTPNCCVFSKSRLDRDFTWGNNTTSSIQTNYYPSHDIKNGDIYACYKGNDGVAISDRRRVGTNKHSFYEDGNVSQACFSNGSYPNDSTWGVDFTSSAGAINCGGGGGSACLCGSWFFCNAACCCVLKAAGGKGGDGLVILKWHQ